MLLEAHVLKKQKHIFLLKFNIYSIILYLQKPVHDCEKCPVLLQQLFTVWCSKEHIGYLKLSTAAALSSPSV